MRDDLRQRSFSGARRSPEDERAGIVALDLGAQGLARGDQVFLADKFIQRARTHTVGQWTSCITGFVCRRDGLEKTHGNCRLSIYEGSDIGGRHSTIGNRKSKIENLKFKIILSFLPPHTAQCWLLHQHSPTPRAGSEE